MSSPDFTSMHVYLLVANFTLCAHNLIVGIGQKSYGFQKFRALEINLAIGFTQKNPLECIG